MKAGALRAFKAISSGAGRGQCPVERGFGLPGKVLGLLGPASPDGRDTKGFRGR